MDRNVVELIYWQPNGRVSMDLLNYGHAWCDSLPGCEGHFCLKQKTKTKEVLFGQIYLIIAVWSNICISCPYWLIKIYLCHKISNIRSLWNDINCWTENSAKSLRNSKRNFKESMSRDSGQYCACWWPATFGYYIWGPFYQPFTC